MTIVKRFFLNIFFVFCLIGATVAQNLDYARKLIQIMASEKMQGRGYVAGGDSLAADFIRDEMSLVGLKPIGKSFFQPFSMSVNTLPTKADVLIDGIQLKPSDDYLILTPSSSATGTYRTVIVDSLTPVSKIEKMSRKGLKNKVLVVYKAGKEHPNSKHLNAFKWYNTAGAEAVITVVPQKGPLTWSVYTGHLLLDFASIEVSAAAMPKKPKKVSLDIENKYLDNHTARNVIGYIEGNRYPDSFFVFTAHYDHLGRMGSNTFFPGAHDNASGVAMMLDLASYYAENPPDYSIAFMAMAAEEAGLLGSGFYAENPLFPLAQIKFLINLDMVSTGEEGMMVVNADVFKPEFDALCKINDNMKYMKEIKSRGEAANSDHYHFYRKGVKSFYFYTLGGYSQYHNIYDVPQTLPMYAYNDMFRLILRYVEHLSKSKN